MRTYLTLLIVFATCIGNAQERYIVYFNSKAGGAEKTISLSAAAMQQRKTQGIGFDINDVAVNEVDILKLRVGGVHVIRTSRWLNAALVETKLPVSSIAELSANIVSVQNVSKPVIQQTKIDNKVVGSVQFSGETTNETTAAIDYGLATTQNLLYNINHLHDKGFTGKGVTIAFFDAGYTALHTSPYFGKLLNRNGIKATYDFWANDSYVFHKNFHGTTCSSIVIADSTGSFVGMAPDVDVLLAITDDIFTETHQDEFNYVAALEWADSIGAAIVSASLSYKTFQSGQGNYTYADMDGKTTIVTKGVRIAAAKGLLIVNAAGNSGHLCAPCDADSILCVGGVDSLKAYDLKSSTGPSFDARVKPDVGALTRGVYGVLDSIVNGPWSYGGTSQAAPQITGIAACLKQAYPYASNIDIIEAIKKSAHQYATPDSLIGYGVPDARKADSILHDRFLSIPPTVKSNSEFRVYPNPAKDEFIIEGTDDIRSVQVTSVVGQTILRKDMKTPVAVIRLDDAAPGVYLVTVVAEDDTISTHRLVVE